MEEVEDLFYRITVLVCLFFLFKCRGELGRGAGRLPVFLVFHFGDGRHLDFLVNDVWRVFGGGYRIGWMEWAQLVVSHLLYIDGHFFFLGYLRGCAGVF